VKAASHYKVKCRYAYRAKVNKNVTGISFILHTNAKELAFEAKATASGSPTPKVVRETDLSRPNCTS